MNDALTPLQASVDRMAALVPTLTDADLEGPAHPTEWSIADVLSHLGSGAVIMRRRAADALAEVETPEEFAPEVWADWDARSPRAQADGFLAADAELMAWLHGVAPTDRVRFLARFGPMEVDWDHFVAMRLGEHLLHEWDVVVAQHPDAALAADGAARVIDDIGIVAGFAGQPAGPEGELTVTTTDPVRHFAVTTSADRVTFAATGAEDDAPGAADVTLPAEAFVRLVYGRLDPAHTPAGIEARPGALEQLRATYPGF